MKNVERADAASIQQALSLALDKSYGDSWRNKLVAVGTDGVSVMTGNRNGLVARLKRDLEKPEMEGIHCTAHKIELAYKDGVKKSPLAQKMDLLLLGIYLFYNKSSLNRSMLKRAHEICQLTFLVPVRVGGTRWLPHVSRALDHLTKSYKAIVLHMKQIQNPDDPAFHKDSARKAKNYLDLLTSRDIVLYIHLLQDIVRCFGGLSELFQCRTTTIASIINEIEAAVDVLTKYLTSPGPSLRKIAGCDVYQGEKLSVRGIPGFPSTRQKLLSSLVDSLKTRFLNTASPILKNGWLLNFNLWPADLKGHADFGDEAVQELITALDGTLNKANIDPTQVEEEWLKLKSYIYQRSKMSPVAKLTWKDINVAHGNKCTAFLELVDLLLSIPASSADAERGFSQLKLVKTDWRSKLTEEHLSDLLLVQMQSATVADFSPDKAIARFLSSGSRRLSGYSRSHDEVDKELINTESGIGFERHETEEEVVTLLESLEHTP